MEFNHGVLFSDTYQKKLKSQFYYADKDPQYGARLFFENSGGSLRLKRAVEAKAAIEEFPDCPERARGRGFDLADYVKEMPQTTYFIFVEEEVDKRSKLYKAVKAKGHIVELPFQDETTLKRWILGNVKREGKQMSEASAGYFLGKVGTDMQNIQGELEKLFCYTLHRDVIIPEDIDAVCINQIGNHIFEMVNAVAEKKQRRALDLYYELLALKEPPMRILFLLVRQYRILFHVQSLQVKGYGRKEIAAKAGLHPFAAGKYMEQTRYFKMEELRAVLEESAELEERVKTGRLTDTLAVELFLVKYSS